LSYDFDHWNEGAVESFALPEPRDPAARGINGNYDQVHLGVGAASFGNVCVGLYGLWHNDDYTNGFNRISCDLGLVISNDGLHFREPVKGHVFISQYDSPATPVQGKNFNTNLCQANGILNVGAETRIYHGRWRNIGWPGDLEDYRAEVALATIGRDRWGALRPAPRHNSGCVWTAPLRWPDSNAAIFLNADGARGLRVEIADEQFHLLPEYSGARAGHTTADAGLDCQVEWPMGDLSRLAGKIVRLKIHLQAGEHDAPRLYAVMLNTRPRS
jgi:hypothetical protein